MPLRSDLLTPIPGDNPSGANLRYDPITDKIKEARREDADVPQGQWKTAIKTADYPAVIKMAGEVVAKRSKDLQIAVWLVDAYVRREGFALLAPSFGFLRDLLDNFWDTLYPEIEDDDVEVRAAPLDWLGLKLGEPLGWIPITANKLNWLQYQESRLVGYEADADTRDKEELRNARIKEGKMTAEEFDAVLEETTWSALKEIQHDLNDGLTALEDLTEYCDAKFGEFSPSFIKTREAMEEIAQTVRILLTRKPAPPGESADEESSLELSSEEQAVEEPAAEEAGEASSELSLDDVPAAAYDAAVETQQEWQPAAAEPTSGEDALRQLVGLCAFLRTNDPEDPAPYLILRSYWWGRLLLNAPVINQTILEAPPSDIRLSLKRSSNDQEWGQVIETAEAAMALPYGATWLDLQRYVVTALEQDRPGTARVVRRALRNLLEGLPDLLDLTLPDDTPSANAETKVWINSYVLPPKKVVTPASEEKPAEETPLEETPLEDASSGFSFDETSFSSDTDTPVESVPDAEPEPEPEAEAAPFVAEEDPPILNAEEIAPTDGSPPDELDEALAIVREGRTAEGLSLITKILATERCGRGRFKRRTQLAHLLMVAGQQKVAQPLLDQLAAEIESRNLDEWEETEALAYPLELLWRCLNSGDEQRKTELYARLCRLDPVRAVNCAG
jgi:type VI secretion system protein ImpA